MKNKNLKKIYTEEIQNSAPDMDALWRRIEKELPVKDISNVTSYSEKKSFITMRKGLAAAAVFAMLAMIVPTALRNSDASRDAASIADETKSADVYHEEQMTTETSYNATEFAYEETNAANSLLSYDDLIFAESIGNNEISCTGKPYGDEYFVEEEVLADTQLIVDAIVDDVYSSDDGSCIYYEMTVVKSYSASGQNQEEKIKVSSCSKYPMMENREYIIPLKYGDDGYQTVYDKVPQIEVTLDSGMVFYSGWKSLDDDAQSIIYPQEGIDDFFYDRMKFSYKKDITKLLEAWEKASES